MLTKKRPQEIRIVFDDDSGSPRYTVQDTWETITRGYDRLRQVDMPETDEHWNHRKGDFLTKHSWLPVYFLENVEEEEPEKPGEKTLPKFRRVLVDRSDMRLK